MKLITTHREEKASRQTQSIYTCCLWCFQVYIMSWLVPWENPLFCLSIYLRWHCIKTYMSYRMTQLTLYKSKAVQLLIHLSRASLMTNTHDVITEFGQNQPLNALSNQHCPHKWNISGVWIWLKKKHCFFQEFVTVFSLVWTIQLNILLNCFKTICCRL